MTLLLGLDFTPIENYETTEEQKRSAAMHAVGRVAPDELREICGMFGLLETNTDTAPAEPVETCRNGHERNETNTRISPDGWRRCRPCERNHCTGENR
jgi:hypothetical protein